MRLPEALPGSFNTSFAVVVCLGLFPSLTSAEIAITEPGETFVSSVDQAITSEPMNWTHRVAEAGDYQLGIAWVEVQSGQEVEVTIMAAGKVVKSLKSQPGLAPQRLETRLE